VNNSLVIIPTYNECENIELIIAKVFSLTQTYDILVIDDNSPDGTAQIVKDLQTQNTGQGTLHLISREGKLGLGTAYVEGFKYALDHDYQFIFEMDADFSHNPDDLLRLYAACSETDTDMVVGSRYVTGVNVVNWPLGRVLLSVAASFYVRFITGMPISDPTAGFICYSRKVLEAINLDKVKFIGYTFQIELKYLAWKAGFRIKEIPIIFTDRSRGTSKMSTSIFKEAVLGVIGMKLSNHKKMIKIEKST
jgi:dolichol-phosphate mannosyltransferase